MIYATATAVGCFNNEGNKVSIKLMLATKLDSMSSSAKQPQSNDNNFLDALNNTKNTYPTKETPQQPIKDKQPTQHNDKDDISTKDDTEQSSSPITTAEEPVSSITTLVMDAPLPEISNIELIQESETPVTSEQVIETNAGVAPAIEQHAQESNITEVVTSDALPNKQSEAIQTPELLASAETTISTKTEDMSEEDIELPEAIASSEIQTLQPIVNAPIQTSDQESQMVSIESSDTTQHIKAPVEITQQGSEQDSQPKENMNQPALDTLKKQDGQTIQTEQPQAMEQAAISTPEAKNATSKASSDVKTQPKEHTIVESVKVEPIANSDTSNPEMSFGFNDETEKQFMEFENQKSDFKPIEHTEIGTKISASQEITTNIEPDKTDEAKSISNQIQSAVKSLSAVNGKSITITLTPESLGRIEVELTLKAGQISTIEIKAAKPETVAILEKNSQMLQDALKEVTGGNDASLSFNLKEGNHGSSQQENAKHVNVPVFDLDNIEQSEDTTVIATTTPKIDNVYNPNSSTVNIKL